MQEKKEVEEVESEVQKKEDEIRQGKNRCQERDDALNALTRDL